MRYLCLIAVLSLLTSTFGLMGTAHTFTTPSSWNGSEHPSPCQATAGVPPNRKLTRIHTAKSSEPQIWDASVQSYETCKELLDPPFDCACMIRFLQARFQPSELEILVPVFAFSVPGTRVAHGTELTGLYETYGLARINEALRAFHAVRLDMFMECPGASLNGEDED